MKQVNSSKTEGIYVTIEDLVRLQYKARGFSFLPKQPVHSLLSGRHASRLRGRGLNFEEIRQYIPGDDIRNIDWKVTARTRKAHTRVFTEERERPALLVVDQRINMFFGTRVAMKSVTAAEAAGLGAWRVVDVGDRVGALVFNDSEVVEISPHRSRARVMRILAEIVRQNQALNINAQIKPNPDMLNTVLQKVQRIATHDFVIAIISDFYGMNAETRRLIKLVGRHNDVLSVMIYDPIAAEIPKSGRFIVSNGEVQIEVDTQAGKNRIALENIFNERLRSLKDELNKFGIPVLPIHTQEPVDAQVRRVLGYVPKGKSSSNRT